MSENFEMEAKTAVIENMVTGVAVFDIEGDKITPVYINDGFFRMLGYSRTVGMRYVLRYKDLILPEDFGTFRQGIEDILKDDGPIDFEIRTITSNGNIRWLQLRGNLFSRIGNVNRVVGVVLDVTERKTVDEELRLQAQDQDILSASEGEHIIDYNAKTDTLTLKTTDISGNHSFNILKDYMKNTSSEIIHPDDKTHYIEVLNDALKIPKKDVLEFRTKSENGEYRWYRANITSIAGEEGYVTRIIGRLADINDKKLKELDLEIKAEKDGMTGLFNKTATQQLINNFLDEKSNFKEDEMHAMLIIDLDNFKSVNDYLGHAVGDEVLVETANQLLTIFKGSDVVGRIGGDEFLVFAKNIKALSNADILATKICKALKRSFDYAGKDLTVTASVGIAICPYHGKNYNDLFKKADKALYSAKANGKNSHRIYDAANTITYHITSRNSSYNPAVEFDITRGLEDYVLQIFREDHDSKSAIHSIIELIAVEYNMQRGYYIPFGVSNSFYEEIKYCADGYENPYESNSDIQLKANAIKSLKEYGHQLTVISRASQVDEIVLSFLMKKGIQSFIFYPIYELGNMIGAFCLENHKEKDFEVPKNKAKELNSIFRILNAYILQSGLPVAAMDMVSKLELMENFDNYAYIIDTDTYQLMYINKRVIQKTNDVNIGDFCYSALKMSDAPCEDCPLKKMDHSDLRCHLSQEVFHYPMRAWMKCNVSWFNLQKEHATALLNCFDISEYFMSPEE